MRKGRNFVVAAALALALGGVSCTNKSKPPGGIASSASSSTSAPAPGQKFQPDEAQRAAIDALVQKLNRTNWRFPSTATNEPNNARLFTYLAATSEDPAVIGAALASMYGAYSAHSKRKAQPDADYVAAVEKHLGTEDPKLAARVLLAARTAISGKEGNVGLIDKIVAMADRDPYKSGPGRYAIIDTLRVVSSNNRSPALVKVFEDSLDAKETYVVSYALQALYRSSRSVKDVAPVKAKALELAKHEDPGVRGRAIELLGAFGKDDPAVRELVLTALGDKSPYVRSEAAESIARLRYRPAIHALMPLVDDKESNRYEIRDWTTLDGKPGRLHHDGSPWSFVYDAAMNAVRSLSGGELELERVNPKEITQGLDKSAQATKTWYAKAKSKIPKTEEAAPSSKDTPAGASTAPKAKVTQRPRPASSATP